jgi:hypothetical protein
MVETNLGFAYELIDDFLYAGLGLGGTGLTILDTTDEAQGQVSLLDVTSGFLRLGALVTLEDHGLSFGTSYATPALSKERTPGAGSADDYHLPQEFLRPWELVFSAAANVPFTGRQTERRQLLVDLDLVLVGSTENALSAQGLVTQLAQPAGQETTFAFRLGAESEVWDDTLKLRLGTYLEPARVPGREGRVHLTLGAEYYLLDAFWKWKITFAVDGAEHYSNTSLGIGLWH